MRHLVWIPLLCVLTIGCGKPTPVPVTGRVTVDGKPMAGIRVVFLPDTSSYDPDRHGSGSGTTDADGKFALKSGNGETGIWPGKYKVTFSLWVEKKTNKPIAPEAKPSEVPGGVVNLLASRYESSSDTPEAMTVSGSSANKEFAISSK